MLLCHRYTQIKYNKNKNASKQQANRHTSNKIQGKNKRRSFGIPTTPRPATPIVLVGLERAREGEKWLRTERGKVEGRSNGGKDEMGGEYGQRKGLGLCQSGQPKAQTQTTHVC